MPMLPIMAYYDSDMHNKAAKGRGSMRCFKFGDLAFAMARPLIPGTSSFLLLALDFSGLVNCTSVETLTCTCPMNKEAILRFGE